jgi:hypothetical protein
MSAEMALHTDFLVWCGRSICVSCTPSCLSVRSRSVRNQARLNFGSLFSSFHHFSSLSIPRLIYHHTIMDLGDGLKEDFPGQWDAIMNAAKEERLQMDRDRPMPVSLVYPAALNPRLTTASLHSSDHSPLNSSPKSLPRSTSSLSRPAFEFLNNSFTLPARGSIQTSRWTRCKTTKP